MVKFVCSNCGKEFERVFQKRDLNNKNFYCCKNCEAQHRKNKSTGKKKQNEIIINNDYAIIKIKNNLLGELDCLIDIEDIEKIKDYFWNIRYDKRHPKCTVYVESHYLRKRIHIHRLLTNCPVNYVVDHIDGNGLNNRKSNLRVVTQSQNCLNRNDKKDIGICYNKYGKCWQCYVCINGKTIRLGKYFTKQEAVKKRKIVNKLIKKGEYEKIMEIPYDKLIKD